MHGQYLVFQRQKVVQYGKDAFFHFAGISRSAYQNNSFAQVKQDKVFLSCAIGLRISLKLGDADDGEIWLQSISFLQGWPEKHVVAKQVVPCLGVNNSQVQSKTRISPCIGISGIYSPVC